MIALDWLAQPAYRLVMVALLHFAWQGLAIGLALVVLIELCSVRRVASRYACSLLALLAMSVSPVVTIAWLVLNGHAEQSSASAFSGVPMPAVAAGRLWSQWLEIAQPYLLFAWLGGVALFGSRLVVGFVGVARLRRGRLPLPLKLASAVERLGRRLQMNALPLVFVSRQIGEAMAVGLVRPLVLIPAAWATEMPLEMLEAVIAHELAHLKRRDLWVNLLQRIVETLLFYHPVVWWLSRRLRIERELCADELAVLATGKRLEYAKALEQIAGERQADIRPALAAFLRGETDMRLLQRVRNVLNQPTDERSRLWPAGVIALALPLGLWAAAAMNGVVIADDDEPKKTIVKRERNDSDVENRPAAFRVAPGFGFRIDVPAMGPAPLAFDFAFPVASADTDQRQLFSDETDGDKRAKFEERVERYVIRKPGQPPQEVERKIVMRDGKPVTVEEVGRGDSGASGDRRIDELTALVKKLAGQVERLQDEVKQLRSGKIEDKQSIKNKFEAEERSQVDARKRELQLAAEKIEAAKRALSEQEFKLKERWGGEASKRYVEEQAQKELAEKKRAIEEMEAQVRSEMKQKFDRVREEIEQAGRANEQAARDKANAADEKKERVLKEMQRAKELKEEAARDKASGERKEIEKKLKSLKERKEPTAQEEIDGEQLEAELLRTERDRQALIK